MELEASESKANSANELKLVYEIQVRPSCRYRGEIFVSQLHLVHKDNLDFKEDL